MIAQLELWNERKSGRYENKVYVLPKHLDEKVRPFASDLIELQSQRTSGMTSHHSLVHALGLLQHSPLHLLKCCVCLRWSLLAVLCMSLGACCPQVAALHLPKLGAKLTVLSDSQAAYINVPKTGPFKPAHYRY